MTYRLGDKLPVDNMGEAELPTREELAEMLSQLQKIQNQHNNGIEILSHEQFQQLQADKQNHTAMAQRLEKEISEPDSFYYYRQIVEDMRAARWPQTEENKTSADGTENCLKTTLKRKSSTGVEDYQATKRRRSSGVPEDWDVTTKRVQSMGFEAPQKPQESYTEVSKIAASFEGQPGKLELDVARQKVTWWPIGNTDPKKKILRFSFTDIFAEGSVPGLWNKSVRNKAVSILIRSMPSGRINACGAMHEYNFVGSDFKILEGQCFSWWLSQSVLLETRSGGILAEVRRQNESRKRKSRVPAFEPNEAFYQYVGKLINSVEESVVERVDKLVDALRDISQEEDKGRYALQDWANELRGRDIGDTGDSTFGFISFEQIEKGWRLAEEHGKGKLG